MLYINDRKEMQLYGLYSTIIVNVDVATYCWL